MEPTPADLAAYQRGDLDEAAFRRVDAWLAQHDEAEQEALLTEAQAAGSHAGVETAAPAPFRSADRDDRYRIDGELGRGGMGLVYAAHDTHLDRPVAIKVLRPRHEGESLEAFALRQRLFRREAGLLAGIAHPGIITVHDVGLGPHGAPAYVMRRLDGAPLRARIARARAGEPVPPAEAAEIILRAAEALAVAHEHSLVHRDLTPDNVWTGAHGEVVIIDWGLAARSDVDEVDLPRGVGTPAWMPPEQEAGAPADPRMDVYALGGLLRALLCGAAPRDHADLRAPRGLGAAIARCTDPDPGRRYADAGDVATELARWFAEGITLAERASWPRRARTWILRHRAASAALVLAAICVGVIVAMVADRAQARQRSAADLASNLERSAVFDDAESLAQTDARVRDLLVRLGPEESLLRLHARLDAARTALDLRDRTEAERRRLHDLARRYAHQGSWTGEADDLLADLSTAGVRPGDAEALATLRGHPLRDDLLGTLTHLHEAEVTEITDLLRGVGDPAWAAMGDLLDVTVTKAHDLVFCQCTYSEAVLQHRVTADLLLAVFGPERRLVAYSEQTIAQDPGAFWPRITLGRAAIAAGDAATARDHALVALGSDSAGLWPNLLLAYAALLVGDDASLASASARALAANSDHAEALLLAAVAAARTGDGARARALADRVGPAHLQYHLQHPVGHPMERSVQALVAAGVDVAQADPDLGPLVPHHH